MERPIAIVRACLAMLPRLEAEESLLASTRARVGSGMLAAEDAQKVTRAWARVASAGAPGNVRGARPSPDQLAAMGIDVTILPPDPAHG